MFVNIIWTVFLSSICVSSSLNLFHEGSRVTYHPDSSAEYFGYSVLLHKYGLIVGAPKASWPEIPTIKPGGVFNCSTQDFEFKTVICHRIVPDPKQGNAARRYWTSVPMDFYRDDMWFGAVSLSLSDGKLLINSPRWLKTLVTNQNEHLLAHGATYLRTPTGNDRIINLLDSNKWQSYRPNYTRKEYQEYGGRLNYYAYGQAGFSAKANKDNTILFGAPGLLQWAGGIMSFSYEPDQRNLFLNKQVVPNIYYTEEIGPDDYFGYSVESGVFQNSSRVMYVASAPRSKMGNGLVLVFEPPTRELQPLNILAKIEGPQTGAYFGGSLCCTDIDGDGLDDLLVGAPMYVKKDGGLPYDQGAVFVYMTQQKISDIIMVAAGHVAGSESDGARFGTSIADLGDVNGDGFTDIAIGAPWENGKGVVYIYRGSRQGLRRDYSQRIEPQDAKGFGISISKGMDVDHNGWNDLAVGAHDSESVYLYRSVPTMEVSVSIKIRDTVHRQNTTRFTVLFCVKTKPTISSLHLLTILTGRITADPEGNRTDPSYANYRIRITPSENLCSEKIMTVKPTADLSKPMIVKFEVAPEEIMKDNDTIYVPAVRLSDDSKTSTSTVIQLESDCGEDMVCTPWLMMELDALDDPYIPGSIRRFGMKVKVVNKEEPAYGITVNIVLPFEPKRLPSECSLKSLNLTCNVPSPLKRNDDVIWEIEMDYSSHDKNDSIYIIRANLTDSMNRNVTENALKTLLIHVTPVSNYAVSGEPVLNATLTISRNTYYAAHNYTFAHYYQIRNHGPSDGAPVKANINLPDKVNLSNRIQGCEHEDRRISCEWSVPAKVSLPIILHLHFDLLEHGKFLENTTTYNATTRIVLQLKDSFIIKEVTTSLELEPDDEWLFWAIIIGSAFTGLLIMALIIYSFMRFGFFMRQKREDMKNLISARLEQKESSTEVIDTDTDSQ